MSFQMEAVFENGVFRPLQPVHLPEHQRVPDRATLANQVGGDQGFAMTRGERVYGPNPRGQQEEHPEGVILQEKPPQVRVVLRPLPRPGRLWNGRRLLGRRFRRSVLCG